MTALSKSKGKSQKNKDNSSEALRKNLLRRKLLTKNKKVVIKTPTPACN